LRACGVLVLASPFCTGCANTIDVITGNRFKDAPLTNMFGSEDPVEVLRTSDDSNVRAKAMLKLREPAKRGGSETEQFEVLQFLATSATSDKQVYCRLQAIETLGRFDDPRTSKILVTAYQTANQDPAIEKLTEEPGVVQAGGRRAKAFTPISTFTADNVATIQCRALEALGKKRTPESLALLCEVATKPAKREARPQPGDLEALMPQGSGQDAFDLRLAAIRALGNFKGEIAAAHTLYQVMATEQSSVAMRNRAHDSLVKVTGQDYPPQAPEWRAYLKLTDAAPTGR